MDGEDGDDSIGGGAGADLLYGREGSDILEGGEGNDSLYGGGGVDVMLGGAGDDGLNSSLGQDFLAGGDGNDSLHGGYGGDALSGGDGADTLDGGEGDDVVTGGSIFYPEGFSSQDIQDLARNGDDIRFVGDDGMTVYDDKETDDVRGGNGNDTLIGGAGDILTGGEGEDIFVTGDWLEAGESAEISDFATEDDSIVYRYDETGEEPVMTVATVDNGDGTMDVTLMADGETVLTIPNAADDFDIATHVVLVPTPIAAPLVA